MEQCRVIVLGLIRICNITTLIDTETV